ncbi:MAG: IS1096 element passenger TnpR family protein [Anaerolineae bacterium]
MNEKSSLTRSEAVARVVAELDGPVDVESFAKRVLALAPSTAKDPIKAVRKHLRSNEVGETLVFLEDQTIIPLRIAMKGVRFRIPLIRQEAKHGALLIHPAFDYYLRHGVEPESVQLMDARGRKLPTRLTTLRRQVKGLFGNEAVQQDAFDLRQWFQDQGARRHDSVIVTIEDWEAGCFRLDIEPEKRVRREEVERRDQEFADLVFEMLESSRSEMVLGKRAIYTAHARMSDPKGYPGNHWLPVINGDERMTYDGWAIRYSNWRSPLEQMLRPDEPKPQKAFSAEEAEQVYRFKASLWHRSGLWRVIEIQGEQTLADFDSIMRDAFEHDSFDHMGGFWKRVRRGKGRRFREVDLGAVSPWGEGDGAEVAVAGLGLEPGDELKYVYDFGDWIEHRLTLQEIVEPEEDAKYPRIVDQNKPRYKYCERCEAEGRKTVATWICIECSQREDRPVLLCEDCLREEHEDHYAEQILY